MQNWSSFIFCLLVFVWGQLVWGKFWSVFTFFGLAGMLATLAQWIGYRRRVTALDALVKEHRRAH